MNKEYEDKFKKIKDEWYRIAPYSKIEIECNENSCFAKIIITWFVKGKILSDSKAMPCQDSYILDDNYYISNCIKELFKSYTLSLVNLEV